jgi:hypothetical protein
VTMGEVTGKRFVRTQARRMQPCASNFIALNPEQRTNERGILFRT